MPALQINNIPIKAIVFDYNGTLAKLNIDFNQMRQSVLELISSYGVDAKDLPADHLLEIINYAGEILKARSGKKAESFLHNAYEVIEQQEIQAAHDGELFKETKDLLLELAAAGISTGVITRNCAAAINIEFPDILSYCRIVICRDHVANVKPHPEHLNKALQFLGSPSRNSLMIGDHPLDIKTGKAAGTFTAGVLTGHFPENDLRQAGAEIILARAADILDMIK
jgi:phosphoglycolate phosphatase